jgi:hypothetical protein
MLFTSPINVKAAGFTCAGEILVAGGARHPVNHYKTLAECQGAVSAAREGFTCVGGVLVSSGSASNPLGYYKTPAECQGAVSAAHEGFTCVGGSLVSGAGTLRDYKTPAECQGAVSAAHEGFTCVGGTLVSGAGGTLKDYKRPAECLVAVSAAAGSGSFPSVATALGRCSAQLQEAQAHDPSGNDYNVKAQYQTLFTELKRLQDLDSSAVK